MDDWIPVFISLYKNSYTYHVTYAICHCARKKFSGKNKQLDDAALKNSKKWNEQKSMTFEWMVYASGWKKRGNFLKMAINATADLFIIRNQCWNHKLSTNECRRMHLIFRHYILLLLIFIILRLLDPLCSMATGFFSLLSMGRAKERLMWIICLLYVIKYIKIWSCRDG